MKFVLDNCVKWLIIVLWLVANIALFSYTFWLCQTADQFFYLRQLVGVPLAVARGSASALNLNLAIILLPVCRHLLAFLRRVSASVLPKHVSRTLDSNIVFHKLCAYAICFWTALHYWAHTFNFERLVNAARLPEDPTNLQHVLSNLPVSDNGTWLNPVRTNDTNVLKATLSSLPGYSGLVATLCLLLIVSSSTQLIRRKQFEIFWLVHHLFIVFYVFLIIHGFGGLVRGQSNVEQHHYSDCANDTVSWGQSVNCPLPQFSPLPAQTWMWVIGPIVVYVIERLIQIVRMFQPVTIVKIVDHPSDVMEIQMRKDGFRMTSPGQYIFIKCRQLSLLQWHPFTLTSAPDDDSFSVHIRQSGDWTRALGQLCVQCRPSTDDPQRTPAPLPTLSVDGPFGTCSEDALRYDVAVMIGAGIGVTPFASVLKHIWYRHKNGESSRLRTVHFYWICRDTNSFEWFVDLLQSLEQQTDDQMTLHVNIYCTHADWNEQQIFDITGRYRELNDAITGLRSKTHFGRPNWDSIFTDLASRHSRQQIGVFFCGPKVMTPALKHVCANFSYTDPRATKFVFNKENF